MCSTLDVSFSTLYSMDMPSREPQMNTTDTIRTRYNDYARRFIDQGMEPVTFDRWIQQEFADREMWERHQSGRR